MRNQAAKDTSELEALEQREWRESLEYVIQQGDRGRVQRLLAALPRGIAARRSPTIGPILALMVAVVVLTHGIAAYYTYSFYQAGSRIFTGTAPGDDPDAIPAGESPAPSDDYNVPPFATPSSSAWKEFVVADPASCLAWSLTRANSAFAEV